MPLLPAGPLSVAARPSGAPTPDDLLGRGARVAVARALVRAEATVRGFVSRPLDPFAARDRLLAEAERGLDVDVVGGVRLRALDAIDGQFHVHVTPPTGSRASSVHVTLPDGGREAATVVRMHPHAPDAPLGFYNLAQAREGLEVVDRIVCAAIASPTTSAVDRLRAEHIARRVEVALARVERLEDAIAEHPALAELSRAARHAYEVRAEGDANDRAYAAIAQRLHALVARGDLSADVAAQVGRDLATLATDRDKWLAWRASTGLHTLYLAPV